MWSAITFQSHKNEIENNWKSEKRMGVKRDTKDDIISNMKNSKSRMLDHICRPKLKKLSSEISLWSFLFKYADGVGVMSELRFFNFGCQICNVILDPKTVLKFDIKVNLTEKSDIWQPYANIIQMIKISWSERLPNCRTSDYFHGFKEIQRNQQQQRISRWSSKAGINKKVVKVKHNRFCTPSGFWIFFLIHSFRSFIWMYNLYACA